MTLSLGNASCPHCGYVVDSTMGLDGSKVPNDGSVTVCFNCAKVSMFQQTAFGLRIRMLSEDEVGPVMGDAVVQRAVQALLEFRRTNPFPPTEQRL